RHSGLGSAAAARDCRPGHFLGALIAKVGLLRGAPSVTEVDPHYCAFVFVDFRTAVVTNKHGPSRHRFLLRFGKPVEFYAACRAWRMRYERSSESVACSSTSRPISRAVTTRKWRGRKSSMVRPSRYWSTTAGDTYDARVTAGVLPSFSATSRITLATARFCAPFPSTGPRSANATAARRVPPQVRKSF